MSSVSDPDLNQIKSGQWIRIRIQEGKNLPTKIEKSYEISCLEGLKVLFFGL